MDERQKVAAETLAIGAPIAEVSKLVGRSIRTVHKWMREPEFQAEMLRGIRASALLTLAGYLKTGEDVKGGQAALATLRWLGAGKPGRKPRQDRGEAVEEDDTGLGEFSREQLERMRGDG